MSIQIKTFETTIEQDEPITIDELLKIAITIDELMNGCTEPEQAKPERIKECTNTK